VLCGVVVVAVAVRWMVTVSKMTTASTMINVNMKCDLFLAFSLGTSFFNILSAELRRWQAALPSGPGPVDRSTFTAPASAPITGAVARAAPEDVTEGAVPSAPHLASLRGPGTVKVGPAPSQATPAEPAPITGAGRTGAAWILGRGALCWQTASTRASNERMKRMMLMMLLLWLAACCCLLWLLLLQASCMSCRPACVANSPPPRPAAQLTRQMRRLRLPKGRGSRLVPAPSGAGKSMQKKV